MQSKAFEHYLLVSESGWRICNQRSHDQRCTVYCSFPESLWGFHIQIETSAIRLKHDRSTLGRAKLIIIMLVDRKERIYLFGTNGIMVIKKKRNVCSRVVCPTGSRQVNSFLSHGLSQSAPPRWAALASPGKLLERSILGLYPIPSATLALGFRYLPFNVTTSSVAC